MCIWHTMEMQVIVPGSGRPYMEGDSLDHTAPLVFTVAGVFDAAECADTIAQIERLGFEDAPITTARGFVMRPDIRNNTRVMFDDHRLAATLFARIGGAIPAHLHGRRAVGVNERFRCYRYEPGQRFAPHYDGAYQRSATERSELTLMVYLNDDFTGGTTEFYYDNGTPKVSVQPKRGMALVFYHIQLHEGAPVQTGRKYVLRTDVMYTLEGELAKARI